MTKDIKAPKKTLSDSSVFSHDAYEYFGVHPLENGGGYVFRVFAPSAEEISVCGDFNSWDPRVTPMKEIGESGVWEALVEQKLPVHCKYKYFLRRGGKGCFKSDPFGTGVEKSVNAASVVHFPTDYPWRDGGWLSYRKRRFAVERIGEQPIRIYRVDPLWWKRHGDGSPFTSGELATELIPYVKQMGYTHVELLGVTGGFSSERNIPDALFAPSLLLGEPRELMALIDSMHEAGMGVILSWNPFCFAAGEHGLSDFDGTPLFEDGTARGSVRFFDLERTEVQNFLVANALFWAKKYHADGLSVASDTGRSEREASFLRSLEARMRAKAPDVMLLASESPNVKRRLMGSEFGDTWTEGCQRPLAWWLLDQHMRAEEQLCAARENHLELSRQDRDGSSKSKTNWNQ